MRIKILKLFLIFILVSRIIKTQESGYTTSEDIEGETLTNFKKIFNRNFLGILEENEKWYKVRFKLNAEADKYGGVVVKDIGDGKSEFVCKIYNEKRFGANGYEIKFQSDALSNDATDLNSNFLFLDFGVYSFSTPKEYNGTISLNPDRDGIEKLRIQVDSPDSKTDIEILEIDEINKKSIKLFYIALFSFLVISIFLICILNCKAQNPQKIRRVSLRSSIANALISLTMIRYLVLYSYSSIIWIWVFTFSCPIIALGVMNPGSRKDELKNGALKGIIIFEIALAFLSCIFNNAMPFFLGFSIIALIIDLVDDKKKKVENHPSQIVTIVIQHILFGALYFNYFDLRFYPFEWNQCILYICICLVLDIFALILMVVMPVIRKSKREKKKAKKKNIVKEQGKIQMVNQSMSYDYEIERNILNEKVKVLPPRKFPSLKFDQPLDTE